MRIEWVTTCRQVVQGGSGGFELIGLFRDMTLVKGDLPVVADMNFAVVVSADLNGVSTGSVVTTEIVVTAPDASVLLATEMVNAIGFPSPGHDHVFREIEAKSVLPCHLSLEVTQFGIYEISFSIGGPAYAVPYLVAPASDSTGPVTTTG